MAVLFSPVFVQVSHENFKLSPRGAAAEAWLLRGLIECGHCHVGCSCHNSYGRHGALTRYYCCRNHDLLRAGSEDRLCPERNIRANELDEYVFEQVRQALLTPDQLLAAERAVLTLADTIKRVTVDDRGHRDRDPLLARALAQAGLAAASRALDPFVAVVVDRADVRLVAQHSVNRRRSPLRLTGRRWDRAVTQLKRDLANRQSPLDVRCEDLAHDLELASLPRDLPFEGLGSMRAPVSRSRPGGQTIAPHVNQQPAATQAALAQCHARAMRV